MIGIFEILNLREPHNLHKPFPIIERGFQSLSAPLSFYGKTDKPTQYLNGGHIAGELLYFVEPARVDITKRKGIKQVAYGSDLQFSSKRFCSTLSNSFEKLYVGVNKFQYSNQ